MSLNCHDTCTLVKVVQAHNGEIMSKDQFVPEAWHGGTVRTGSVEMSDDLSVTGKESRIGTYKSDSRVIPVTRKTVDRSRDLRNCFSTFK